MTNLPFISQGEEKTSEEKESTGVKSDEVAPPEDGLSDEVRERKRLSLVAQQVTLQLSTYFVVHI